MTSFPKISIVTPSFNDAKYLERTILSLLTQGYPNLEYIIIDGGSTDGSIDIIRKYESQIAFWISEKDKGMYSALQKGFQKSTGEIMGWINSDDRHQHGSLFLLAQIFSDLKKVNWVQGCPTIVDVEDRIVFASPRPQIDKHFFYLHKHIQSKQYIQQESTFWRRSLWEKSGGYISERYKYAGDFDLWIRFFQYEKLFNVPAVLGSFRLTGDEQISFNSYQEYSEETKKILKSYPLAKKELNQLKLVKFLERIESVFARCIMYIRAKASFEKSSIHNKIHFERQSQKFKM